VLALHAYSGVSRMSTSGTILFIVNVLFGPQEPETTAKATRFVVVSLT
jgi:hypothetical protein